MGLKKDLPLLTGIVILLAGLVYAGGTSGLPGIGSFDNPFDEISSDPSGDLDSNYDLTAQYTVGSTATGEVYVKSFTYQTQKSCTVCLSIGESGYLALTGANNVKSEITVTNQETGKTVLQTTKFLGELSGTEDKQVNIRSNNLETRQYEIRSRTTFDPKYFDLTNDGEIIKSWTVQVPKVQN